MIGHLLNKWLEIEIATVAKGTTVGQPKETFTLLKETRGGVLFTGGRMVNGSEGQNVATDATFTVRYDERINYKCRVKYLGQYYRITHIEPIGRSEGFNLKTIMWADE
jgi:head-tail adaptor